MTKTYAICALIILAALAIIVGPDAREMYYEAKCQNTGGVALWLGASADDQRDDGWTQPYCRIDGIDKAM